MAATKDIAIYGAGGFGREVACLINRINEVKSTWNLVGFFDDDASLKGKQISHYGPYLGGMEELNNWENPLAVVVAVGSIILQQIKIGNNIRLGAGSVLMTKPKEGYLYMGVPAKKTDF